MNSTGQGATSTELQIRALAAHEHCLCICPWLRLSWRPSGRPLARVGWSLVLVLVRGGRAVRQLLPSIRELCLLSQPRERYLCPAWVQQPAVCWIPDRRHIVAFPEGAHRWSQFQTQLLSQKPAATVDRALISLQKGYVEPRTRLFGFGGSEAVQSPRNCPGKVHHAGWERPECDSCVPATPEWM